jgi:hypothetical protein
MEMITSMSEIHLHLTREVLLYFSKNNFEFKIKQVKKDDNGNLLGLDLTIEDKRITLINIYGPIVDKKRIVKLPKAFHKRIYFE